MPKKKKVEEIVTELSSDTHEVQDTKETLCFKCQRVVPTEHPVKAGLHYCSPECF